MSDSRELSGVVVQKYLVRSAHCYSAGGPHLPVTVSGPATSHPLKSKDYYIRRYSIALILTRKKFIIKKN